MNIQILWAMLLVTMAFGSVVIRDKPPGPDLEVDNFMISEKHAMDYHNYTAEQNIQSMRSNALDNIHCDFNGQYLPHPTCCYMYVRCSWSTPIERPCPLGTAWSESNPPCGVHDYNSKCGPRPPMDNQIAPVSSPIPSNCFCGMAKPNNRIVGGVLVKPEQKYPWVVGLWRSPYYFNCGGSIINNRFVLTAAHCFYDNGCDFNPNKVSHVHIGEHNQDSTSEDNVGPNNRRIPVKRIIIHPCFNCISSTRPNDFALVELNDLIVFNDVIRPVCLPADDSESYTGKSSTVAGWGRTAFDSGISPILRELDVTILDNNNCGLWDTVTKITPNHLCAREPNTWDKNFCKGDSGSPLVVKEEKNGKSRYVQVGVVSYSAIDFDSNGQIQAGCNVQDYPGVYGRVSKVLDWIKAKSASGEYCAN